MYTTQQIMEVFNRYEQTHMPYVAVDNNEALPLFSIKINGTWKIHYIKPDGSVERLQTGFDDSTNECSPVAFKLPNEGWVISYMAGASESRNDLGMYLTRLDRPGHTYLTGAFAGFYRDVKYACVCGRRRMFGYPRVSDSYVYTLVSGIEILCIHPIDQNTLLISYKGKDDQLHSVLFMPFHDMLFELHDMDGLPLYKGSRYAGCWFYTKQIGDDFEDRKIFMTPQVKRTPVDREDVFVVSPYKNKIIFTGYRSNKDILSELPEDLR